MQRMLVAGLMLTTLLAGCAGPPEETGTHTAPGGDGTPISQTNPCYPGSVAADEIDSPGSTQPDQIDTDPARLEGNESVECPT